MFECLPGTHAWGVEIAASLSVSIGMFQSSPSVEIRPDRGDRLPVDALTRVGIARVHTAPTPTPASLQGCGRAPFLGFDF